MAKDLNRRDVLRVLAMGNAYAAGTDLSLSSFTTDVSPRLGGPLFNAVRAKAIVDPLEAHGLVWLGFGKPVVLAAVDWCEIRNESYERWRSALAHAVGTEKERVLVTCVHQHDAPYSDMVAQRLLKQHRVPEDLCDPEFDEETVQKVASAARASLTHSRRVTHIGTGQAKVQNVASNRRYVSAAGRVSFERTSATRDPLIRAMPIGTIDPWLKTISFWDNNEPIAAVSCYSTHPMTFYGQGEVSCDFPGIARRQRAKDMPSVAQIYCSGCSGDTMAGKYNDGSPANRPILADRIYQGMKGAWDATERQPLRQINFRSVPMRLVPRRGPGFTIEDYRRTLADTTQSRLARFEAALGLSWRQRTDSGHHIDVPAIDFGYAEIVLLPAETFVQYQLWAQAMRPESFVMTLGFGECAPGYIPTAEAAAEGYNDHYSWIAFPECEPPIRNALKSVLRG